jgi:membrane protease YdiL (CAAX protease family)
MVVIVAPVFEELIFRGILLSWLSNSGRLNAKFGAQFGRCMAVVIAGVSFGVAHMQLLVSIFYRYGDGSWFCFHS